MGIAISIYGTRYRWNFADAPSWWAVYNGGKNIQACKDFLNSLASTEEGAKCLVQDCGMISPFKSTTTQPTAPLATDLMKWVQAGKLTHGIGRKCQMDLQ